MLSVLLFTGCSTTTHTVDDTDKSFENFLVIAVAPDYESRSQFERMLAHDIRQTGASARAYYSAIGGNKPITQESIEELIARDGYDAVLIAQVTHSEADSKAKTIQGRTVIQRQDRHLFRYDYTQLNEGYRLEFGIDVGLNTEIYSATSGERAWGIESELDNRDLIAELIEDAVSIVVRRMQRDDLIAS